MSKNRPSLERISTYDTRTNDLTVIIETPKGSRSKYAYDPEIGTFALKFVLPAGMTFPVDFGFVPSTLGADGDPLDIIILLDETLSVGTKVSARLIGAIEAEEREKDGAWERNDRLVAVATHAHAYDKAHDLRDLDPALLPGIERFFESYNRLHDKDFRVKERVDAKEAGKLVKKGMAAYQDG
ncbi:inorganic diphosphatase [Methylobacterium nodulans]|uniref:inorganic diphosphatase n=1 Tax=Methylobacterium nodulans (strain LMG 21967 / CNCM I-2342 / ORS 2060) TaxID=460265 RepID=B8IRT6_METNO|nr:inorganic diphosphatase [Methylobacterium nodulans]ACL60636.1 Inorganic pyrophosphatase [Methylobacterium nodulans ORS 2060]